MQFDILPEEKGTRSMLRAAHFLILTTLASLPAQTYRVTHTYPLGGDGAWDYVVPDPSPHRLFIARQNRVMVVDEDSGSLLGEVKDVNGAHGTAIAATSSHGFATSSADQSVVMFDLKSFKVLDRIPAAEDADAIVYDRPSDRVFTFNGDAHSSTVIDAKAGKLITNIPLGGKPEYGASAGDGKVYANLTDSSEVVEIEAKTATVTRRWSTAPCKQPVAMALDTNHRRLFSGCRSGLMAVSDYEAGKVVATLPIGKGVDGAGYDAASGDAFASNADGTLTIIHQDTADQYRVVGSVPTPVGSRNMGLDPSSHRIFVVAAKFGPAPASGKGRPPVLPGSFTLLVIEREGQSVAEPARKSVNAPYADKLVKQLMAEHSDLKFIGLHVTPPGETRNLIIACPKPALIGKESSSSDMEFAQPNRARVISKPNVDDHEVDMWFGDSSGRTLGMLVIHLEGPGVTSDETALREARSIEKELQKQISSREQLFKE
jgi:DNA-binding beta-propeller fold protein YncE